MWGFNKDWKRCPDDDNSDDDIFNFNFKNPKKPKNSNDDEEPEPDIVTTLKRSLSVLNDDSVGEDDEVLAKHYLKGLIRFLENDNDRMDFNFYQYYLYNKGDPCVKEELEVFTEDIKGYTMSQAVAVAKDLLQSRITNEDEEKTVKYYKGIVKSLNKLL
jgi:hypothetical protein